MLEEGLSYPFKGENALGRFVIGAVLLFFSFLILPAIVYYGYLVRVLRDTANGLEEPPEFDDWGGMLVDGLKMIVITVVYGIVPFSIAFGVLLLGVVGGAAAGESGGGIVAGFGLLGFLVFFLASLVLLYVLPAAVTNFAREDRVGAAFDFDTIGTVLTSSEYVVAWLLPLVVYMVVSVVTFLLIITFIGVLLLPFVSFYAAMAIFYMFGRAYAAALDLDDEQPDQQAASPMA